MFSSAMKTNFTEYKYREVFLYFLRLGFVGFGGPLALIGMMQKDLVETRGWMPIEEFHQAFAMIKAMPGPVAFQTAVFLGRRRAGLWGGLIAAVMLNLPAFLLMVLFGYYYQAYENLKSAQSFLSGMQASALVMVLVGMKSFFLPYYKRFSYWMLLIVGAVVFFKDWLPEPVLIIGGASVWAISKHFKYRSSALPAFAFVLEPKLFELMGVCAKAGAFVFGTGLAIVPMLEKGVVENLHWMTHSQFMDALAMGQITPGPVVITATFIGFKTLGLVGAVVSTVAIFAPSFFHIMTWFPSALNFLSRQKWITDFVFAATSVIVGTLIVTTVKMMTPWQSTPWCFVIFAIGFLVAVKTKIPSWVLIPAGGFAGLLFGLL